MKGVSRKLTNICYIDSKSEGSVSESNHDRCVRVEMKTVLLVYLYIVCIDCMYIDRERDREDTLTRRNS